MKNIIICIFMVLAFCMNNSSAYAQNVQRQGNTFVSSKSKTEAKKTQFTWKDSKGNIYPIYVGATGSCYVLRVSNKTGKEYKQYLGAEISSQVCKELGIKYSPKSK